MIFEPKDKKRNPPSKWGFKQVIKNNKLNSDSFLTSQIRLSLGELRLFFTRIHEPAKPHETTVVIPRAEIRSSLRIGKYINYSKEMLLNSITLVDSPQRSSTSQSFPESDSNHHDPAYHDRNKTIKPASDRTSKPNTLINIHYKTKANRRA
ncbi:MAG: hypothetical protein GX755_04990 [Syntrophomonadaceae bacterium]|nr:hypothetical protein [Syntrophomonadaceae bacterium]